MSEVSIEDLHAMRMANPTLQILDVREDTEALNLPIPPWYGAVRIGRGVLERNVREKIPDLSTEVVIICAGGMRSVKAAEIMQTMGYTKVHSLKEGIEAVTKGHTTAAMGTRRGFIESVGNTPLIRLNKYALPIQPRALRERI